ncbi:hypothetical protein AbraIFM66950_011982 [Aspergillus brasiliensis]|nr:hypothetical protein AbraIFM66950_011982 [Aspergillus brasiliensis]
MIRLLPHRERKAPIECILIDYDLSASERRSHLYEALSYTWGSNQKPQSIVIDGCLLPVTENLHTALSYLRDHQLERILWVDAVCIDQEDEDEKNTQIPLMRAIYAQADRVIVWLGEPDHTDHNALVAIHQLAESKLLLNSNTESVDLSKADHDACMRLLRHDWFRRIWVLQEVGVARSIMIQCGLAQVNGYAFCEGLSRLDVSSLPEYVFPVIHLVRGSIVRPRNPEKSPGSLPIGELIDMYHSHLATVPHDKIYALLGLCSDDLDTACLRPNYQLPWSEVLRQVVTYIFGGTLTVAVLPSTHRTVINGKGWILGRIVSVERNRYVYDRQTLKIDCPETRWEILFERGWGAEWVIHASANSIQTDDLVCLLEGASKPSIVRLTKSRISIIVAVVTPRIATTVNRGKDFREPSEKIISDIQQQAQSLYGPPLDLILTWDISKIHRESRSGSINQEVPSIAAPTSRKQTSDAEEQELRCRQLVVEEIFALILRLFGHERQIGPIKRLMCQSLVQISVGQRALEAAAEHAFGYELLKLLLDGKRKNRLMTETSINNAKDVFELIGLLFCRIDDVPIDGGVTNAAASSRGLDEIRLPYQHKKQLPISERTLIKAVGNSNAFSILHLFYQHQDSLPVSEEVVNAVVESGHGIRIRILRLFLEHEKGLPISATTVQLAIASSHRLDMLHFLQQCRNSLPISEEVVRAAINHDDGLAILRLLYHQERNLPISQRGVSDAVMGPDAFEVLNLLYQFQENLPISYSTIQTIAAGLWRPVSQKMLDMPREELSPTEDDGPVLTVTKPDYEYSRKCLRLIYQHQRDVVLEAATEFDFEDKIKAMLRDIDEKESERLYRQGTT